MKIEISVVKIVAFFIICLISHFSRGSNISRFTTSTPIICGTSTNYNIDSVGLDSFSAPYQWQFINSNDSTLLALNDVTTKTLGNQTQSIQYKLWRRISRVGTANPDTSNWVLVTMNPLPTANISGTIAVCKNATAPNITFTGASGTAPYTFTYNINGGSNTTVSTTIGNSVTVAASTANAGTFTYNLVSVQNTGISSCTQAQSGSATITINPLPTASISGTTAVCKNASSPNITFTGASGTAPYTFTYNINGGSNTTVSTTSGNSVTVAASTANAGTFTYNLVSVQDASSTSCSQAQSGSATITVNPVPTASISGTTTKCKNSSSPNITFTGASGTAPYTFTYNINGGTNTTVSTTSGNSVTVAASTANAGTFTYNLVSVQDASSTACSQTQSGSATITVNPLPTASISGTITVCKSSSSPNITFTGASGTAPYTFTYNINGGTNTTVSTTSGNSVTVAASTANAGTFTYNLVSVQDASSTSCSQSQSGSAIVTINPIPVYNGTTAQTICSGATTNINLTANTSGGTNSFSWVSSAVSGITGNGNASGSTLAQTLSTSNTSATNVGYLVTPTFTFNSVGCLGAAAPITITVNPIPVKTGASTQTICSGLTSNINLTANTSGGSNTFSYTTSVVTGLSGNTNSSGSPTSISQTLSTTNNSTTIVNYLVTPTYTYNGLSCQGLASTYAITVNPRPSYKASTDTTICSNTVLNFNMSSNTTGTNYYTWRTSQVPNVSGNNPYVDSAFSLSRILVNSDSTTRTVIYKVLAKNTQPSQPSCYASDSTTINIYVNPIPIIRINSRPAQPICSGTNPSLISFSNSSYGSGINTWDWGTTFIGGGTILGYSNANNQTSGSVNQLLSNSGAIPGIVRYAITPKYTLNNITCIGSSNLQDIVVNPTPKLSIVNTDSVMCNGEITNNLFFKVNTTGATNRFDWQILNNSGLLLLDSSSTSNTVDVINNDTLYNYRRRFGIDFSKSTQQGLQIQVTPYFVNGTSCIGNSKTANIYMNPIPIVKTIFGQNNFTDTTICSGTILNMSVNTDRQSGSSVNNSFLWESNISQGTGLSGNTVKDSSNIFSKTNTLQNASKTNGELTYTITPYFTKDYKTCSGGQRNFIVTINPIPDAYFKDAFYNQVICSGTSFKDVVIGTTYDPPSFNKVTFDWNLFNPITKITGLQSSGSGNIVTKTLTNSLGNPDSLIYNVVPSFTYKGVTCSGNFIQSKIIVNPIPSSNNPFNKFTYCSDNFLDVNAWSFTTSGSPIGKTDYIWKASSNKNNIISDSIIKTTKGTNVSIPNTELFSTFRFTNDLIVDLNYTVTPTYTYAGTSCPGSASIYTITINPKPQLPVFTKMSGLNPDSVCFNNRYINYSVDRVSINNDVNNYNYFWEVRPNNLPIVQSKQSNLSLIDFTINPPGGKDVYVRNTLVNNFGCNSSDSMKVYVRNNEGPRYGIQVIKRTNPNGKEQLWCLANDANGFQWGVTNKITFRDSVLTDEITNVYNLENTLLNNYNIWVKLSKSDVCAFKYYYNMPSSINNHLPISQKGKLIVYPNPANSELAIKLENDAISGFEIYNSIGELVYINEVTQMKISESNLDVSSFASGVYFLKVKNDLGNISLANFIKN
jgi:hypothetical protein